MREIVNAFSRDLAAHLRSFSTDSPTSRLAFKTTLACVLSVLASLYLELPQVHWAAITAAVVTQPRAGATVEKSLLRMSGTAVGATLGVFLANLAALGEPVFFLIVAACTAFAMWSTAMFPRTNYAFSMASITGLLVVMGSLAEPGNAFYIGYYRAFEICIGILCSLVVSVVLLPDLAEPLLKRNVAGCLGLARTLARLAVRDYFRAEYDIHRFNSLKSTLDKRLEAFTTLAQNSQVEGTINREHLAFSQDLVGKLGHMADTLATFYRQAKHGGEPVWPLVRPDDLKNATAAFNRFVRQAARYIFRLGSLREVAEAIANYHQAVDGLENCYTLSRSTSAHLSIPVADVVRFHQFIRCFKAVGAALALDPGRVPGSRRLLPTNPLSPGYRPMLKQILVSTTAMVLVPFFWIRLDIPGLAEMAVSAAVIGMQVGDVETERKAFLRFTGCLLGGSVGLLMLGSQLVQYFWGWLLVFAFWIYMFSYIKFGKATFSYIGLQANLALIMAFIQGRGPATSLAPPVERLVAITLAAFIILALISFMPDSPVRQLRRALEGCEEAIRRLLDLAAQARPAPADKIRDHLEVLKQDMAMAWRRLGAGERMTDADRQALETARRYLYACELVRGGFLSLLATQADEHLEAGLAFRDMHPDRVLAGLPKLYRSPNPAPGLARGHARLRADLDRRREQALAGKVSPLNMSLAVSAYYLAVAGVLDALDLASETRRNLEGLGDAKDKARQEAGPGREDAALPTDSSA